MMIEEVVDRGQSVSANNDVRLTVKCEMFVYIEFSFFVRFSRPFSGVCVGCCGDEL